MGLALVLLAGLVQSLPPTRAVQVWWDLDPTHDGVVTWEVEADGQIAPCTGMTRTQTGRWCTWLAEVRRYASIRLRGVTAACVVDGVVHAPCVGGWSAPIAADLRPPGPLVIRVGR